MEDLKKHFSDLNCLLEQCKNELERSFFDIPDELIGDDVNDHVMIDELLTAMCNGTVTKEQYVRFAKIKNAQKIHKFIRDILYNHVYGKPKE